MSQVVFSELFASCVSTDLSFFFFSSRRRHTRCSRDWSSDVCSSDLTPGNNGRVYRLNGDVDIAPLPEGGFFVGDISPGEWLHYTFQGVGRFQVEIRDRKSTRLNSSHGYISYAVFCLTTKQRARRRAS